MSVADCRATERPASSISSSSSVSNMAEVLRDMIEREEKLLHGLKLPGPVFLIEEVCHG